MIVLIDNSESELCKTSKRYQFKSLKKAPNSIILYDGFKYCVYKPKHLLVLLYNFTVTVIYDLYTKVHPNDLPYPDNSFG